ncbi:MAG: hypothetical protein WA708_00485 [Acidobacteriaceae bacterium]
MDAPYRLKIKVGVHEFEAEGLPGDVKEQFQAFKELVSAMPVTVPQPTAPSGQFREEYTPPRQDIPPGDPDVAKIMKLEGRVISLTVRPKTAEEAVLLLMYGQRVMRQSEYVTGSEIVDGLETTGGLSYGRSDRLMEKLSKDGDVIVTGENRGKRYRMTNTGVAKARQLANDLLAIVA